MESEILSPKRDQKSLVLSRDLILTLCLSRVYSWILALCWFLEITTFFWYCLCKKICRIVCIVACSMILRSLAKCDFHLTFHLCILEGAQNPMKPKFIIYIANSTIEILLGKFLNAKLLNIAIINMVGGHLYVVNMLEVYVSFLERLCFWRALRSKLTHQFIEFLHCWCCHITSPIAANFWFCNFLCRVPT
jgi:hypothetical protein